MSKAKKERGPWLSVWLVLIALHSLLTVWLVLDLRKGPDTVAMPYLVAGIFIFALARLAGAVGIWIWKKWGLYAYIIGVVGSMVVGLILTGSILIVFNDILPLAILGWLLKDKYSNFA